MIAGNQRTLQEYPSPGSTRPIEAHVHRRISPAGLGNQRARLAGTAIAVPHVEAVHELRRQLWKRGLFYGIEPGTIGLFAFQGDVLRAWSPFDHLRPLLVDLGAPVRLRVLDLFSGAGGRPGARGGWSQAARDRGHDVRTLDMNPAFEPTYCMDALEFSRDPAAILGDWSPDVVFGSPPCEGLGNLANGNWRMEGPRRDQRRIAISDRARLGIRLAGAAVRVLNAYPGAFAVLENPRAGMRTLPFMRKLRRQTITYCQFGDHCQKPTDLIGRYPNWWVLPPACRPLEPCHAPSDQGVVATRGSVERAIIPYRVGLEAILAAEAHHAGLVTLLAPRFGGAA